MFTEKDPKAQAEQRLQQEIARRGQERIAAMRQRSRRAQREDHVEALACPSCKQRYDFGDFCPACDVALVSASLADSVEPEHQGVWQARERRRRLLMVGGFAVIFILFIVAMVLWIDGL